MNRLAAAALQRPRATLLVTAALGLGPAIPSLRGPVLVGTAMLLAGSAAILWRRRMQAA